MIGTLKFVDNVSISSDGAAELEGGVEAALPVTRDRHPQVAWEGDDEARLRRGVDVDDHHGVGALAADLVGRAERLLLLVGLHEGPRVGSDDQEVRGCALLLRHQQVVPDVRGRDLLHRVLEEPVAGRDADRGGDQHEDERDRETTKEVLERGARSHDYLIVPAGLRGPTAALSAFSWSYSTGSPRSRAMSSRWISLVPSPISRIFASR